MTILFTGFEPFGGDSVNPSWEAVSRLPEEIGGARIEKLRLPVSYSAVRALLREALEQIKPDAVVCVGQAGGRAMLTPEQVAINLMDAKSADNDGRCCAEEAVRVDGPTAYFASLPVKQLVSAMQEAGIPAAVSYTAGTYVCNATMYHLLDLIATEYPQTCGGFVHIPFLCEQTVGRPASTPSLPLETMVRGLIVIAKVIAAGV